jgi:hypothetical protein
MASRSFSVFFAFLFYALLQILLFDSWYMVLFDYGFCYIYVAAILLLPFDISLIVMLLAAFGLGFVIDNFNDTLGLHASATVLIAFLRPYVIRLLTPQRGYDERMRISLQDMGLPWFASYVISLVLIHHSVLFLLEASSWTLLGTSLLKILLSTFYTGGLLLLFQYFRKK